MSGIDNPCAKVCVSIWASQCSFRRVQTAERHVRAPSEAEALAKVQAELDKPYGFIGGWQTIDTDMDIVEVMNPLDGAPQQINQADGGFLLTIKAAAKYLGLSYSTVYEMLNQGEIAHVVGR